MSLTLERRTDDDCGICGSKKGDAVWVVEIQLRGSARV